MSGIDEGEVLRPTALIYPPEKHFDEIFVIPRPGESYPGELEKMCKTVRLSNNVFDLMTEIAGKTRPLVLIHAETIDEFSLAPISNLRDLPSQPFLGLLFDRNCENLAFSAARRLGIGILLPDKGWRHAPDWQRWLHWARHEDLPVGLDEFFSAGTVVEHFPIRRVDDKGKPVDCLVSWAESTEMEQSDIYDYRLAMEEMINNCIYHGFANAKGRDKYNMENFTSLEGAEEVVIEFAADDDMFGLRCYDTGGRLSLDIMMERILNQLSMHGLMDENGRGLFLLYTLSTRLIVRIWPKRRTEILALFFRKPLPEHKEPGARPVFALMEP